MRLATAGLTATVAAVAACSMLVSTDGLVQGASDAAALDGSGTPQEASSVDVLAEDGGADARVEVDDGPGCDAAAPFAVALVPGLEGVEAVGITLTADEKLAMIQATVDGGLSPELYLVERTSRDDGFTELKPLTGIPSGYNRVPAFGPDGKTLFFAHGPQYSYQLFYATASAPGAMDFAGRSLVDAVDSPVSDTDPYAVPGAFYFTSTRDANAYRIWRTTGTPPAAYTAPIRLSDLDENASDAGGDTAPIPTQGETTLYFASSRRGTASLDVYVARRNDRSSPWQDIQPVPSLQSPQDDAPRWISADRCTLYFYSMRSGARRLYVARR